MSLRYETRQVHVAYYWINSRGYLYCHHCTPEEHRAELEFVNDTYKDERCGECRRIVGEVTVETMAQVAVEYVAARIF